MVRPLGVLVALALACSTRPLETGSDSDGPTSSGSSDGDPPGATTTESTTTSGPNPTGVPTPTVTGDPPLPTTSGPFPTTTEPALPDVGTGQPCSLWDEDCPEGQKCMPAASDGSPNWDTLICVPIAPNSVGLGEPCEHLGTGLDGLDTCGLHMMCWDVDPDTGTGTCSSFCNGPHDDPSCTDPEAICIVPADGPLSLCHPTCDPLQPDCSPGDVCVPVHGGFVCTLDASGEDGDAFDACDFVNDCDPGFACVPPSLAPSCDPMQISCCLPYCDVTAPDPCPGLDLECLTWFPEGETLPGLENLGVCGTEP
ncbi:hypothetical protein OV142_45140 [Nannocystis sp. SCPEA4]|nr:hypothetical protein [Nannocystis sp. SCPEA4]